MYVQQKLIAGSFSAWRCADATARTFPFSFDGDWINLAIVSNIYIYICTVIILLLYNYYRII